jgi:hypothetical protein
MNGAPNIKKRRQSNKKRRSKKQAKSTDPRAAGHRACVTLWMKREVLDQTRRAFEWSA